jgi:hypothetical protein
MVFLQELEKKKRVKQTLHHYRTGKKRAQDGEKRKPEPRRRAPEKYYGL